MLHPIDDAEKKEKDISYEQLKAARDTTPANDIMLLIDDMNARTGNNNTGRQHIMGKHGVGTMMDIGDRDFCKENA